MLCHLCVFVYNKKFEFDAQVYSPNWRTHGWGNGFSKTWQRVHVWWSEHLAASCEEEIYWSQECQVVICRYITMFVYVCGGTHVCNIFIFNYLLLKSCTMIKIWFWMGVFLQCAEFNFSVIKSHRLAHFINIYFVVVTYLNIITFLFSREHST